MSDFFRPAVGDSFSLGPGCYTPFNPPAVGSYVVVDLYLVDIHHDSAPYLLRNVPPRDRRRAEFRVGAVVRAVYKTPGGCVVEVETDDQVDGRYRFVVGVGVVAPAEPVRVVAVEPVVEPPRKKGDRLQRDLRVEWMLSREASTRVTLGSAPLAGKAECCT